MKKKSKSKPKAKKTPSKPKTKLSKPIGAVTHFYSGIKVGIFKFTKPIKVGTEVLIKGATTDSKEKISSMQFNHKEIKSAPKGKQVGIKLKKRVRVGDKVFETKG